MRGIEQFGMFEAAETAGRPIRAHDDIPEALLMNAHLHPRGRVPATDGDDLRVPLLLDLVGELHIRCGAEAEIGVDDGEFRGGIGATIITPQGFVTTGTTV